MDITKRAFVLSLIATVILPIFLWTSLILLGLSVIFAIILVVGLILPIMITGLLFIRKPETSKTGGMIILIMGGIGIASSILLGLGGEGPVLIVSFLGAIMAIIGGHLGIKLAREKEDEIIKKTKEAFVLSLIATVTFIWFILLWQDIVRNVERLVWDIFGHHPSPGLAIILAVSLIGLIISMMILGLLFMRKEETLRKGGTVVLITGIAGMALIGPLLGPAIILGSIMATIGGYLAIKEEDKVKQFSKAFIISTMGFVSALLSVFVFCFSWIEIEKALNGGFVGFFILFVATPLWIVSIILNIISTVIRSEETIPEKRTKILIIVTWCLIALGLTAQFYLYLFL